MTFRQFPATGDDGRSRVVIEFRDPGSSKPPRYTLEDGRPLVRQGQQLSTPDGEVRLVLGSAPRV